MKRAVATRGGLGSNLTGLFPYGRQVLPPRFTLRGGEGRFMVALGMDGLLLDGGDKGLTIRSGTAATLSGPSSEESQRWQRSRGCVSLLRPGLEVECPFPVSRSSAVQC
ncbi:MAG: hypothetical protein TQ37_09010 [Candidatus Synechococcus spongiarum 15L]|uniref:Uncharacterized protein n=1 Tax=Candidatus Synechococcus spongiarum 15L TaxID=1608419 RepID=A0A0G8ASF2_9SYNE|nr:MAG: hypothetical protein TQ37_09010 [Candidatus Synechococcus spongiarum 15L]